MYRGVSVGSALISIMMSASLWSLRSRRSCLRFFQPPIRGVGPATVAPIGPQRANRHAACGGLTAPLDARCAR